MESSMHKPDKEYIAWVDNGNGGYVPTFFDTAEEAILMVKYSSDWYLTVAINNISAYASYNKPEKPKS